MEDAEQNLESLDAAHTRLVSALWETFDKFRKEE